MGCFFLWMGEGLVSTLVFFVDIARSVCYWTWERIHEVARHAFWPLDAAGVLLRFGYGLGLRLRDLICRAFLLYGRGGEGRGRVGGWVGDEENRMG